MTLTRPDGRTLAAGDVVLRLLTRADAPALREALDDDRVWSGGYLAAWGRPRTSDDYDRFVQRLADPDRVAYVVTWADRPAEVIGTTSIGDISGPDAHAEIGWTAYAPATWGTAVNPSAKLALMTHLFEECGLVRVALKADAANARSLAAIAKLGATCEGTLRRHQRRADGTWRDTVYFSVLDDEWPAVKRGLQSRIASQ